MRVSRWWAYVAGMTGIVVGVVSEHRTCRWCGHSRQVHQHYRRGTDCGLCTCTRFKWYW